MTKTNDGKKPFSGKKLECLEAPEVREPMCPHCRRGVPGTKDKICASCRRFGITRPYTPYSITWLWIKCPNCYSDCGPTGGERLNPSQVRCFQCGCRLPNECELTSYSTNRLGPKA